MSSILLSLAVSGRNDQYGHDFKRRFTQAMNLLAWSAAKAGALDKIEVVFADWNSHTPLAEELTLSPEATGLVRFIEIPPATAIKYNDPISPFQQSVAFNTAMRRARGNFIGIMPADILFTSHALRNLLAILDNKVPVDFSTTDAVLAVPRKNLPFFVQESHFFSSPMAMESLLLAGDSYMLYDNLSRGLMGGYGAFLFARELLGHLRGVDQRIAGWGYNDIDIALRCADRAKVINTSGYGICCYDFEPSKGMVAQKESKRAPVLPIHLGSAENPTDWGLAELDLKESKSANRIPPDSYSDASPVPEILAYRDWVLWLSQRVSALAVPAFSATALAAGWFSNRYIPRHVLLCGFTDRSIITLLSLTNPLAELTIAEQFLDDQSFYKIWYNDAFLGSLHYQGRVHYLPELNFNNEHPFDLIIVDDQLPKTEFLRKYRTEQSTVILSPKAASIFLQDASNPSALQMRQTSIHGILVFSPHQLPLVEISQQWHPMNGNLFTALLMTLRKHFSKIVKLRNILLRQPLLRWPHALLTIRKIRK